jgi:hypothetical protein
MKVRRSGSERNSAGNTHPSLAPYICKHPEFGGSKPAFNCFWRYWKPQQSTSSWSILELGKHPTLGGPQVISRP